MTVKLQQVPARDMDQVHGDLMAVYRATFTLPPYNEGEQDVAIFGESLARHVQQPGFHCYVAQNGPDGQICGFTYGFTSLAGQRWHDFFAQLLEPQARVTWLADCFVVVELAVMPDFQGQGIGGQLHDALLADVPRHTAILSTAQHENTALHLYWKRGWQILAQDVFYPGGEQPFYLLGLDLTAQRPARRSRRD